jgi:hypothetical protein
MGVEESFETRRAGLIAAIRVAPGEEAFAAAWAKERAMGLDRAVSYALEEAPASGASRMGVSEDSSPVVN